MLLPSKALIFLLLTLTTPLSAQQSVSQPSTPTMSGPSIDNDIFFAHITPPLPPDWTWPRLKAALSDQSSFLALPESTRSLLVAHREARDAHFRSIRGADEAARWRRFQIAMRGLRPAGHVRTEEEEEEEEEKNPLNIVSAVEDLSPEEIAVMERFDMPLEQVGTALFEIAEVMHRWDLETWGFMVFRTGGYAAGQAGRWDEFWTRWVEKVSERLGELVTVGICFTGLQEDDEGFEERFRVMHDAAMAGGIIPRWRLLVYDDEALSGWGPDGARALFRELLRVDEEEEEEGSDSKPKRIPVGVDWDLCLMVDDDVMSSLLDEGRRPYVVGVLSDFNDKEVGDDTEALHFKIALESVVDLWRQVQVQHPGDLMEGSEGKIYISPGVFVDDDSGGVTQSGEVEHDLL